MATVSKGIRFSEAEMEAAVQIAQQKNLSFNAYIRRLVQRDIQKQIERKSDNNQRISADIAVAIATMVLFAEKQDSAARAEIELYAKPLVKKIERVFDNIDVWVC